MKKVFTVTFLKTILACCLIAMGTLASVPVMAQCSIPTDCAYDGGADDAGCSGTYFGCTDGSAMNYDPGASCGDPGVYCTYCSVYGCTDPAAYNYDPGANCDNGSCAYCPTGFVWSSAYNSCVCNTPGYEQYQWQWSSSCDCEANAENCDGNGWTGWSTGNPPQDCINAIGPCPHGGITASISKHHDADCNSFWPQAGYGGIDVQASGGSGNYRFVFYGPTTLMPNNTFDNATSGETVDMPGDPQHYGIFPPGDYYALVYDMNDLNGPSYQTNTVTIGGSGCATCDCNNQYSSSPCSNNGSVTTYADYYNTYCTTPPTCDCSGQYNYSTCYNSSTLSNTTYADYYNSYCNYPSCYCSYPGDPNYCNYGGNIITFDSYYSSNCGTPTCDCNGQYNYSTCYNPNTFSNTTYADYYNSYCVTPTCDCSGQYNYSTCYNSNNGSNTTYADYYNSYCITTPSCDCSGQYNYSTACLDGNNGNSQSTYGNYYDSYCNSGCIPSQISASVSNQNNTSQCNSTDGYVELSISGGNCSNYPSPQTYMITGDNNFPTQWGSQSPVQIYNLSAGTYNLTVDDYNNPSGYVTYLTVTIGTNGSFSMSPPTITFGYGNECYPSGGSDPAYYANGGSYSSYSWGVTGVSANVTNPNISSTSVTFYSTGSATISVTVTDGNGCTASGDYNVNIGPCGGGTQIQINNPTTTDDSCGRGNGTLRVDVSGGDGANSYTYEVKLNGNVITSGSGGNSITVSGLGAGSYSITISDAANPNDGFANSLNFTVNASGAAPVFSITGGDPGNPACYDTVITFSTSTGFASYQWSVSGDVYSNDPTNGATLKVYSTVHPVNGAGSGTVNVTVTDANGCSATSFRAANFYSPPAPSFTVSADTLRTVNAGTYQWYLNNNEIAGATSDTYIILQSGDYSLEVTDANGCSRKSGNTNIIITSLASMNEQDELKVYPNPFTNQFFIQLNSSETVIGNIQMTDVLGRTVPFRTTSRNSSSLVQVNLEGFSAGVYYLKIQTNRGEYVRKMVMQ